MTYFLLITSLFWTQAFGVYQTKEACEQARLSDYPWYVATACFPAAQPKKTDEKKD